MKKVILVILDGVGHNKKYNGNHIFCGKDNKIFSNYMSGELFFIALGEEKLIFLL